MKLDSAVSTSRMDTAGRTCGEESRFDSGGPGAKTDLRHFRHLTVTHTYTHHHAAFCFTSFLPNHWLRPCHRWNYVAMVLWPIVCHFQERSLLSASFVFVQMCTGRGESESACWVGIYTYTHIHTLLWTTLCFKFFFKFLSHRKIVGLNLFWQCRVIKSSKETQKS